MRLLIVEDDADIRESLGELLAAEGFTVCVADNGRTALDALAIDPLPDVILLDLMMPIMSGEQFRVAQLAEPRIADIPIVIMSAARELTQTAQRLGASGVLKKPIGIEAVVDCLRSAVNDRGSPAGA